MVTYLSINSSFGEFVAFIAKKDIAFFQVLLYKKI